MIRISRQMPLRRRAAARGGFTLIELVVVVGIIIALLSLVLAVSTLLIQQNEARQLEAAFANLETAVLEYEQTIGRPITFQNRLDPGGAWDVPKEPTMGLALTEPKNTFPSSLYRASASAGVQYGDCNSPGGSGWCKFTAQLFSLLRGTQSAEDIIARLDPSLLVPIELIPLPGQGTDSLQKESLVSLHDPWGNPVAVVFPGRMWREGDTVAQDSDGTIRTYFEHRAGICRNGKVLFVSAGPDGDLGNASCSGGAQLEATFDNVYSYKPGTP